uniref:Protein AAR2 homolog n=1 Tax=Timema monikensis TaxID=170555 RepID=A0A7R9HLC9_9NEOP|nr:unnamed protein product [Timema monikensis]
MSSNGTVEMDQELARRLLLEGAIFIFLDVPSGTEFGIDMKHWNTGEKFKGVKMIPPGIHYVHYSATNSQGDTGPRVGFIHNFQKSELVVKRWDKDAEDISDKGMCSFLTSSVGKTAKIFIQISVLSECFIFPVVRYNIQVIQSLFQLKNQTLTVQSTLVADITCYPNPLAENVVNAIIPTSGYIRSALELLPCDTDRTSAGGAATTQSVKRRSRTAEEKEEDLLPQLKPSPGTELRFSQFPECNYPEGATPAEITRHSLDSSYVLETLLSNYNSASDLIGELQFAFVCFLVGHSLEAFEHWKKLVGTLCSCDSAVSKHRELFYDTLTTLETQLEEIPEDFLVDIVTSNNFIYHSLRELFRTLQESDTLDHRLKLRAKRLAENLTARFGWDFTHLEEEDSDEAPVVVKT